MKTHSKIKNCRALTLIELLVIIAVIAIFFVLLIPPGSAKGKAVRINCASNLKQVGLAFRIWEGDNVVKTLQQCSGNWQYPGINITEKWNETRRHGQC